MSASSLKSIALHFSITQKPVEFDGFFVNPQEIIYCSRLQLMLEYTHNVIK